MQLRHTCIYIACAIAIPLVLLFPLEIICHTISYNSKEPIAPDNYLVSPSIKWKGLYQYKPNVYRINSNGYVSIKGDLANLSGGESCAVWRPVGFTTNSLGYKATKTKSLLPYEIIILGDSFGAGYGTNINTADHLSDHYSTYNLSVGGSPWNQLMTMKYTFDKLDTAEDVLLVWMLFEGNDLGSTYGDMDLEPYEDASDYKVWLVNMWKTSSIRSVARRIKHSMSPKEPNPWLLQHANRLYLKNFIEASKMNETVVRSHPNFHKLENVFDEMSTFNVRTLVLCIPTKERVEFNYPRSGFSKAIESLARDRKFGFIDLTETLRTEESYWADDTHWNEVGHALVGELIKGYMSVHLGTTRSHISSD